jgi:hypothetical protein
MNFGIALTQNRVPGLKLDASRFDELGDAQAIAKAVLFTESTPETQAAIAQNGAAAPPAKIAGLVIGSPDFQRR